MKIQDRHRELATTMLTWTSDRGISSSLQVQQELVAQGLRKAQANDVVRSTRKKLKIYRPGSGNHNPNPLTHPPVSDEEYEQDRLDEARITAAVVDKIGKKRRIAEGHKKATKGGKKK
jgi:hypothetical protein